MESKIIQSSELGTECWSPARFCAGARCARVHDCTYRIKATCQAIDAEIAYMDKQITVAQKQIAAKIKALKRSKQ
jgi:hypothetical protein